MRFRLLGVERDRLSQVLCGFRELLEPVIEYSQMEMPLDKCWLQLHIEGVRFKSLLRIFRLLENVSEIIPDFQFCRPSFENLRQAVDGQRIFFLFSMNEGHPKVRVPV